MVSILGKIFSNGNDRELKRLWPLAKVVNDLEPAVTALNDEALRAKTTEFRQRLTAGEDLDDLEAEAFAMMREGIRRLLGQRAFAVQVLSASVLHQGKIAEMKTGEGKTLVASLALYLNALEGRGAHLITVNDYLA